MPLDARGRPKRTWAVCGDCLRYRPTRKSYWKAKQSVRVKTKTWDGVVKEEPGFLKALQIGCYKENFMPILGFTTTELQSHIIPMMIPRNVWPKVDISQ
jgi:hypothetical protein